MDWSWVSNNDSIASSDKFMKGTKIYGTIKINNLQLVGPLQQKVTNKILLGNLLAAENYEAISVSYHIEAINRNQFYLLN